MQEVRHGLEKQPGRIEYIDIFRSFGIILMVMGHIRFGSKFDLFIHAFHMPMFFFISGFLFKNKDISFLEFIKNKAKSLLIPYFVFSAVHFALNYIINGEFSLESLKGLLYPNSSGIPIAGALWFLSALFFADIIYFWINKIKNAGIRWIAVIVIALIGQIVPEKLGVVFPLALSAAFVGAGLMHIGRALRPYESQITSLKLYQIIFFGALTAFSIMVSGYVNMRKAEYPISFIVFWVNAVAAIIIGMNIAKKTKEALKDSFICKYLQGIGRNSIVYLCLNEIVILLSYELVTKAVAFAGISAGVTVITKALCLLLSMALLRLLSLLFEKTFLRVLVGRNKK